MGEGGDEGFAEPATALALRDEQVLQADAVRARPGRVGEEPHRDADDRAVPLDDMREGLRIGAEEGRGDPLDGVLDRVRLAFVDREPMDALGLRLSTTPKFGIDGS